MGNTESLVAQTTNKLNNLTGYTLGEIVFFLSPLEDQAIQVRNHGLVAVEEGLEAELPELRSESKDDLLLHFGTPGEVLDLTETVNRLTSEITSEDAQSVMLVITAMLQGIQSVYQPSDQSFIS